MPAGQSEMFAVYRYHAVFTDSPQPLLDAEATHRDHAIVEQVIADLKDSPLAHLPSGKFPATGTIRAQLIGVPARLARSAHRLVLHLPQNWPWPPGLDELFRRALHDPLPATAA
jgi:hypothetical protein